MSHNLKIYNTLTGKKEQFEPRKGKKVNFFVCGPTVYDYSHLGHARTYIVFDAFVKYLRHCGYNVFYLQNITDIDDKIIMRAREREVPAKDLSAAFLKEYLKSMKALKVDSVNKYAKATDYMKEIINQIKRLQDKKFAYKIEGDGVYFNIAMFKDYGKLSGRTTLQAEDAVSRIDYSKDKKNRGDFCLWKLKQESLEPSWKSPWGQGRPGWHIEDTAITEKFFGPQYDIHGAARDLIFPHHEAEIAQMEAISDKKPMAKYWMHGGFLTVNGQKMSKSLNNFILISDLLKRCPYQQLRFMIVKNLWQSPMDYSESAMIEVRAALEKIEEFLRKLKIRNPKSETNSKFQNSKLIKQFKNGFYKALDDNFNTPQAFATMFDFIKKTNEILEGNLISNKGSAEIYKFFQEIDKIFGIINWKKVSRTIPAEIKKLVKERELARKNSDWQKSDGLRAQIEEKGFSVEDTKSGPAVKSI
ncbi:MAG: cysteine--tRNA ligase [Candidatus Staskawiczbacteria bacterium]|nr:cysteine--tRNA ligase [Candidatus Staskawiczbacteria bacterium]